jgi:hypothetical protein
MCRGSGSISYDLGGAAANAEICEFCSGEGELAAIDDEPCARCGGDKRDHSDHEFQTIYSRSPHCALPRGEHGSCEGEIVDPVRNVQVVCGCLCHTPQEDAS